MPNNNQTNKNTSLGATSGANSLNFNYVPPQLPDNPSDRIQNKRLQQAHYHQKRSEHLQKNTKVGRAVHSLPGAVGTGLAGAVFRGDPLSNDMGTPILVKIAVKSVTVS